MPTAIFVPDIPVKVEADDDEKQCDPHENLQNEHRTKLNVKIETTSDDQNQHSHETFCSNRQIIRTEENAQTPTAKAGNNDLASPRSHSERWDDMFEALHQYETEHGHTNVPTPYADYPKLGRWVSDQRRNYKAGDNKERSVRMCEERIDRLESIVTGPANMSPRNRHGMQCLKN